MNVQPVLCLLLVPSSSLYFIIRVCGERFQLWCSFLCRFTHPSVIPPFPLWKYSVLRHPKLCLRHDDAQVSL